MRSRESNPAGGCTMSEAERLPGDHLGFITSFVQDPRSAEVGRLAVVGIGELAFEGVSWAWDELKKSFSRPPQARRPPPPTAAAIPASEEATVAPAREGHHGTPSLGERVPWEGAVYDR